MFRKINKGGRPKKDALAVEKLTELNRILKDLITENEKHKNSVYYSHLQKIAIQGKLYAYDYVNKIVTQMLIDVKRGK